VIYTNGDSWTQRSNVDPDYSWPSVLQTRAKCQVVNEAAGCGSNSRILSNIYKLYHTNETPSLILLGLTVYSRWHLPSRMGSSWNIGPTVINDRFNTKDEDILPFFINHVYDEIEYIYQMFNQIWQINELATNYFRCPVIFFNSWSAENYDLKSIHYEILKDPEAYVLSRVDDSNDYSTEDYIKAFEFFKKNYKKLHIELDSWRDLVYNHIDDEKGLHPGHPSPEGHRIICDSVVTTIEQKYPKLYKELI